MALAGRIQHSSRTDSRQGKDSVPCNAVDSVSKSASPVRFSLHPSGPLNSMFSLPSPVMLDSIGIVIPAEAVIEVSHAYCRPGGIVDRRFLPYGFGKIRITATGTVLVDASAKALGPAYSQMICEDTFPFLITALHGCPALRVDEDVTRELSIVRWMALTMDLRMSDDPGRYITGLGHSLTTGDAFIVTRFHDRRSLMLKDRRMRPYRCFQIYDKAHEITMRRNAPLRARGVDPALFTNTLRVEMTLKDHDAIRRTLRFKGTPTLAKVLRSHHFAFRDLMIGLEREVRVPTALDVPATSSETLREEIARLGMESICARCDDDPNVLKSYLRQRASRASYYRAWRQFKQVLDDRRRGHSIVEQGEGTIAEITCRVS